MKIKPPIGWSRSRLLLAIASNNQDHATTSLTPTPPPPKNQSQDLPQVIVLKPPPVLNFFRDLFSKKFDLLVSWESPLPTDQFLTTHAHSVQAMLCSGTGPPISADIIRLLPSLKLVVTTSAGLNHIDLTECRKRGIAIANAGEVFSEDVADMAVALLIDVLRKVSAADRYVRQRLWATKGDFPLGSKLGGKRIGIVGLGSIGFQVAKRLEAFGCSILYNSRKEKEFVSYPFYTNVWKFYWHWGRKELLSILGRGAIIDEKELVQCLVQGEIGGAGLDVFENEPNAPKELFALDNVVLAPHMAVFTPESFKALCDIMIGNLEAFFSNKPLLSPVMNE
uniref:D-isomer specific 2-hydroxyacid dehydrogenase NAD-binding domain-containing protein n=1 Tax=Fagus sylvatica TaxID=28930 RepID=A0A2N9G1E8_FAGSY